MLQETRDGHFGGNYSWSDSSVAKNDRSVGYFRHKRNEGVLFVRRYMYFISLV